ncbi:Histidine kinase osmosensor [Coniosporium tulheliwenetii]|uniref:Histidine kinase osmosensor n=1 Tax=Coniosporium tulheliwenetii TaxID=3383036 RepID=A0ACC2ZL55_9PEZI|nr:Histidine kinase osmosensor [Cladosporium sp. JES 115]
MRIPIREQLGALVLFASLVGLAVISVATWLTNRSFVLDVRSTRLELIASLKASSIQSTIIFMQSSVRSAASRVMIQSSLREFYEGNNTDQNWARAEADLAAVLNSGQQFNLLLQAQVFPHGDGPSGAGPVISVTGAGSVRAVVLPSADGSQVLYLGDDVGGYPSNLYPNFTYTSDVINETSTRLLAEFDGRTLDETSTLLLGPWALNSTFSLFSMTLPIINNTSAIDILGWMTVVMDGRLFSTILEEAVGLDDSGIAMLVGPDTRSNKFPDGVLWNNNSGTPPTNQAVRYALPPSMPSNKDQRHPLRTYGTANPAFDWADFPAVRQGLAYRAMNDDPSLVNYNADSRIAAHNEEGEEVAVGYATPNNSVVDWLVVVEQSRTWTVVAPGFTPEDNSIISGSSHGGDGADDPEDPDALARKEGFFSSMSRWRKGARQTKEERGEERRRRAFRIPGKVKDRKHFIHDELTDLTQTFNEMSDELMMQYEKLEERVQQRTAELELSKKAAEAASESKTLFIANISHELKTPLNGILGMCAVCMSEEDPTKIRQSLGIIYKSGDLLLNLLTDLLTFSKNQVGQHLSLDEKEFRLRDISAQVLAIFDKQAKENRINLRVKYEGPADANSDAAGTINDSRPYGPFGLGKSQSTANETNPLDRSPAFARVMANDRAASPPPGRYFTFEFEVEDTGPGIPEHLQQRIFEPFVQGDLGLSKKYGGTGLGLSICSQLASLMQGSISLKSEVGRGSTFKMEIPLKHITNRADSTASSSVVNFDEAEQRNSLTTDDPHASDRGGDPDGRSIQSAPSSVPAGPVAFEADSKPRLVGLSQPFFASNTPLETSDSQRAAMERVTKEATNRGGKVKVLVAEDNKINQEVVLRMLKLEDIYDVTIAKDGQEAFDMVKESMAAHHPYNLIFMDVQMPNLNGIQSTKLIRQSGYTAPIVALTAFAEESNVRECLDSGMDFFLAKPIKRPALKHVLKTYIPPPPIPEEEYECPAQTFGVELSQSALTAAVKTDNPNGTGATLFSTPRSPGTPPVRGGSPAISPLS